MLLLDSIYESRLGHPVYYGGNGYVPITPPYSHPYDLYQHHHQLPGNSSFPGFTKSERGFQGDEGTHHQPPLVYPQFPTPPLSVSPGPSTSPPAHNRPGDSFQIKRLLNLDATKRGQANEDSRRLAMRTASVIMKIEDQRVFQVDSTTTASLTDEESSFDQHHHHHHPIKSGATTTISAAPSESLFICKWEKCYKVFCRLNDLAGHVTQAHGAAPMGSTNYYCQWEGCPRAERGFNARYKMLVHVRTHTKEKPHQCPECSKCFSRAENLKIHIRSHSGEKPYICPVEGCNKAYSNSSDRFKHTRTHSMDKPYQCKVAGCNKRYTDPSSLRKHVKTYKHKSADEALMQERITSTSDDVTLEEKAVAAEGFYRGDMSPCCTSINQQMTDLDLHERSPCCCTPDNAYDTYQERVKMYRLGAIFNVNSTMGDVHVSSSTIAAGVESNYGCSSPKSSLSDMEIESPLDLSTHPPRQQQPSQLK